MNFFDRSIICCGTTILWALVLGTVLSACALFSRPPPIPQPSGPDSSVIGLEMINQLGSIDFALMIKLDNSARVYDRKTLHRLYIRHSEYRETDAADPKRKTLRIESFYGFTVEPGTYAVVGFSRGGNFGYFSEEDIKKSITKVEPGSFKYMGQFYLRTRFIRDWNEPDRAQKHYWGLILSNRTTAWSFRPYLGTMTEAGKWGGFLPFKSNVERIGVSSKAEADFLAISKEALKGGGWDTRIDQRMRVIRQ